MERERDVATRARVIEWLKTEVIDQTARLFKAIWEGNVSRVADGLAGLIASGYILGRRLGIPYRELDAAIADKLKQMRQEGHQLEDQYKDLSELSEHIRKR